LAFFTSAARLMATQFDCTIVPLYQSGGTANKFAESRQCQRASRMVSDRHAAQWFGGDFRSRILTGLARSAGRGTLDS
jgi:hypothetical protein